jgi:hypothetical protein
MVNYVIFTIDMREALITQSDMGSKNRSKLYHTCRTLRQTVSKPLLDQRVIVVLCHCEEFKVHLFSTLICI